MDFTLSPGDVVTITIDQVGTLRNVVVDSPDARMWLTEASADPHTRGALFPRPDQ
jgi:fumarylacetoacetate (FAA) hydrolase family protein